MKSLILLFLISITPIISSANSNASWLWVDTKINKLSCQDNTNICWLEVDKPSYFTDGGGCNTRLAFDASTDRGKRLFSLAQMGYVSRSKVMVHAYKNVCLGGTMRKLHRLYFLP